MEDEHQHIWLIKNFPIPIKNNLTKSNPYYRLKKVLLDFNTPLIVYTGMGTDLTNNDTTLDDILSQLSKSQLKMLRNQKIDVYWYEPLTFMLTHDLRKELRGYTDNYICRYGFWEEWDIGLTAENFTIIDLDYLQFVAEKYNIIFNVYTCDYNIDKLIKENYSHLYKNLNCYCYDIFIRDVSATIDYEGNRFKKNHRKYKKKLKYKFINYNLRFSSHRHLTVASLAARDTFYTWTYNISDKISSYHYGWVNCNAIDCDVIDFATKNHLNNKLSVVGDIDDIKPQDVLHQYHSASVPQSTFGFDDRCMVRKVQEGFLYVITESRYAQPIANISEKTFRSFQAMRPFVLVAPPFSLEYLHKLGYKTFGNWWDESYDKIEDHSMRFSAIIKIINYIDSLDKKQLQKMIIEMEDIFNYNYDHHLNLPYNKQIL